MMPAVNDGAARICWLASAIAGGWLWQTPAQREETALTLGASYLTFAKRRSEMPAMEMEVADAFPELMDVIARTLPVRANKRLCKKLGIPYHRHYRDNANLPF